LPDAAGHFGSYGGKFVAETLMGPLAELEAAYFAAIKDAAFLAEFARDLQDYVGRPSPLYHAERLSRHLGGAQIYLKREDLNHTGAHKINNTVGQALLARRMGKRRVIAETGAGQHGVATATVAARFGMSCVVYMGADDIQRQSPDRCAGGNDCRSRPRDAFAAVRESSWPRAYPDRYRGRIRVAAAMVHPEDDPSPMHHE
jgi:tryptophan synthase beta chain